MNSYKILNKQVYSEGDYSIVPIRFEDRHAIMKWRNEQMYHLRQDKMLTVEDQENYFNNVVSKLFAQDRPNQILFSYLKGEECIGYGGLVHINWVDKNAEISFIMNTELERENFVYHWCNYLELIKKVAFSELVLHKIFTYAFDLRPHLYTALINVGFDQEATLKEHCLFKGKYIDVLIHSFSSKLCLREAKEEDTDITYKWASDQKIREYSFNKDIIVYEEHKKWFINKTKSKNTQYFILDSVFTGPLGSIRIDLNDKKEWTISYLIDSYYHGRGLGVQIINLLEKVITSLKKNNEEIIFIGLVQLINKPSLNIFRKLEYSEEIEGDVITFKKTI